MCDKTKSNQANWYVNFQPVYESSLVDWFQRDGMTAMPANTSARCSYWKIPNQISLPETKIRLMEEILNQLIWYLSHCLRGFIHLRWCRISSINSSTWKSMVGRLLYVWVNSIITKQSDISVSNHHGLFLVYDSIISKGYFLYKPLCRKHCRKANVGQLLCQDSLFERLWTNHDTFAAVYEAFQVPRKRDPRRGRYTPGVIQWLQTWLMCFGESVLDFWTSFQRLQVSHLLQRKSDFVPSK